MNKFRSFALSGDIFKSLPHAQNVPENPHQFRPLCTNPSLHQGLTFRSYERHIQAPVTVTAWSGTKQGIVRAPGEDTKGGTMGGGGGPPWAPVCTDTGSQGSPSILTGSPSAAPSFFTCGKKTPCETPRRRQGHQVLKEALVLGPREVARTVATDPGQDGKPEGNACAGTGPTSLLQVCPRQGPSPRTCGCGSQVPSTWTIMVTNLSLTSQAPF